MEQGRAVLMALSTIGVSTAFAESDADSQSHIATFRQTLPSLGPDRRHRAIRASGPC